VASAQLPTTSKGNTFDEEKLHRPVNVCIHELRRVLHFLSRNSSVNSVLAAFQVYTHKTFSVSFTLSMYYLYEQGVNFFYKGSQCLFLSVLQQLRAYHIKLPGNKLLSEMRFSQQWRSRLSFSGFWHHVGLWVVNNASPKCWGSPTILHGVTTQKTTINDKSSVCEETKCIPLSEVVPVIVKFKLLFIQYKNIDKFV
jgi:hypothetical protein